MKKGKLMLTSSGITNKLNKVSVTRGKIADLTSGKKLDITKKRGK